MALPFSDLARFVGMAPDEAQDALHRLVDDIRIALASEGQCDVAGVGRFVRRGGTTAFQPDTHLANLVNSRYVGLEAVSLPDYQTVSTPAPTKPVDVSDPVAFPGFDAGGAEWGDDALPWSDDDWDTPPPPAPTAAFTPETEPPPSVSQPPPPDEPPTHDAVSVSRDMFSDEDVFGDVWDETPPSQTPHPLGPASDPRFEEADFDFVPDLAPDDVPPPRTRQEAATHANDLLSWFQRNPDESRAADALLLAARRYEEAGMMQEAGQLFSEFVKRFPDHPQTNAARRSLGWMEVGPEESAPPTASAPPEPPPPAPPTPEPPQHQPPAAEAPPRSPLSLVTPPPPPPEDIGTPFEEWSPTEAPGWHEQPLDASEPEPPVEEPLPAIPRFEMGPPDDQLPLPPPPRRYGGDRPPTAVIEARRQARRTQERKRNQLGLFIISAVLFFALALAAWYVFLRPGTTPTSPVTNTPEVVEPETPDNAPAVAPETLVPAADPLRSADPIDPAAGGYMWVMGSYPTMASATQAADGYRAQGFRAGVVPGLANTRRVFRVGVGQFDTQEAAQAAEGELPATTAPGRPWLRLIGP